jgi:hypothetical protein
LEEEKSYTSLGKKKEFFGTLVKFEKGKDEFNVD